MLAIIAGHLWTADPWVRPVLYTWHVPVFFFLTGYLWNERRTVTTEIRQRALTVLLPFALWLVLLTVLFNRDNPRGALGDVAHEAWYSQGMQSPFWAYWFALALFFAAIGYRLVSQLGWLPRTAVVLGTAIGVSVLADSGHLLRLDVAQGLVCMLWIFAGHAFRALTTPGPDRPQFGAVPRAALGTLSLVVAGVWIAASDSALGLDLGKVDLGVPVQSVLVSLLICTGLVLVGTSIPARGLPAVTSDLARAALVVMFVHVAVITQAGGLAGRDPGEYVVVAAASWGIGLLLVALPRTSWLTGQRRSRRNAENSGQISGRIPQPVPVRAE